MVKGPAQYRWSSFRAIGQGKPDAIIKLHSEYQRLSRAKEKRCEAYRALFKVHVDDTKLKGIRSAVANGNASGK